MKLCFLTHDLHLQTGIGVFSRNLIERIAKRNPNWDVAVFVEEPCGHPLERGTIQTGKRALPKTILKYRSILKKYDIVHALDGYPYGVIAVLATIGIGTKVYITAVGTGAVRIFSRPLFRYLFAYCYRKADKVFSISAYTARKVKEHVPDVFITPILLGINVVELAPQKNDNVYAKKINLAKKIPYILTVGSFKPRKGQCEAMRGFIEAVKAMPELNYVFEGDDNNGYCDEVKRLAEAAGIAHKVFFVGHVSKDELRVLYNNAALFIMLPHEVAGDADIEGFGMVFLDAAAAGLPVIGSVHGPSPEAVNAGENSVLVDPQDAEEVGGAIVSIMRDDKRRKQMGAASRAFARRMSWEHAADRYIPHYTL